MRINELTSQSIKGDRYLTLLHVKTDYSNYNDLPTVVFYFVDEKQRVWVHHQICKSNTCDIQIRKFFANLGFNMKDREPMDLYVDYNMCKRKQDSILFKAVGRVYIGNIVKRKMQWTDKEGKTVRKVYFDVDYVANTWDFLQDKLVENFKKHSVKADGTNVYDSIGFNELVEMEEVDYELLGLIPTWKLKEEELIGGC